MGRAKTLVGVAPALFFCAAIVSADCVSLLRDASSGVFNRVSTAVASTGSATGVASIDESNGRAIYFSVYSEDLAKLTGDRKVADVSFLGVTSLLWNGSEFGLFYQDSSTQLLLQRISAGGELIGTAVPVAPNHPPASDRAYDVVWEPLRQAYVVGHSVTGGFDRGIWLTLLNRDGSVRTEQLVTALATFPAAPRVAVNSRGTMAVVFLRAGMFSLRLFDRADVGGTIQPVIAAREVRIASSGSDFAIVGNAPVATPAKEIDWTVVGDGGNVIIPVTRLVSARGAEIAPVSLVWNPQRVEWALAYLDSVFGFSQIAGDYRLRRFTDSGSLLSDSTFSPDPIHTRLSTAEPFVWTGSSYTTAASRIASGSTQPESYVIRHCPLTATIATAVPSVRASEPVIFNAAIDGGAGDTTYTWSFGDSQQNETGRAVTHRFERLGDYVVTLRVSDSSGATSVSTMTIHVITPKRRGARH